ncbi:MAG: serine hydrolase domain-containing protein [Candidatus Bathyarchaeota archaeon]
MLDSHVIEDIERFVSAELSCRGHPGSSLSIIMSDEIVWAKGFSYADLEKKVTADPETVYRCASVTKPVVTVGLLQLMEKGKFHLDDEANSHLDIKIQDVQGDEPTIRDLLTHRSGMPTRVPPIYLFDEEPQKMKGYLGFAARAVKSRGEAWAYCNTAYMIIGYLIELFSGVTYDRYVSQNVLKPLEMRSSAFTLTPEIRGKLAQGYKRAGGPDKPLIPVTPYILGTLPEDPAGSLYSNVLDLANFVIMNMMDGSYKGRRILREETVEEMHRLQAPTGNSRSGMGLTWFYSVHDGHVMLNHTGGLPDFTNNVCFYPVEKVAVCWLSNLQDGSGWRPPAPTVLRLALGEKSTLDESLQAVPENWENICGLFGDDTHQVSLTIRNGYLTLDNSVLLERLDDARYRAYGPSNDGYEVTIEYGENGQAKSICFGTTYLPRYIHEGPEVDASLVLEGDWRGEYHDSSGFHTLELTIEDEHHGTLKGPQGETIVLEKFNANNGLVTGCFQYKLPKEYARWGTSDHVEASLELKAIKGNLKGALKSRGMATPITLTKPHDRLRHHSS